MDEYMSWGTYYKYDGYVRGVGKNDLAGKIEECDEHLEQCYRQLLAIMAMNAPASGVVELLGEEPIFWNDYVTLRLNEIRVSIEDLTNLKICARQALEAMSENSELVEEG